MIYVTEKVAKFDSFLLTLLQDQTINLNTPLNLVKPLLMVYMRTH